MPMLFDETQNPLGLRPLIDERAIRTVHRVGRKIFLKIVERANGPHPEP